MRKVRVLQVFTILNRGGAETSIMNYYRHINREQFHFDFLVHRSEEGAYEKEILDLGGQVFRLPAVHPLKLKAYKEAVAQFFDQNEPYDIIHGQLSELGVFIYEEAKKRGVPVIIAHAHNAPQLKNYDAKFLFRELWKRRMRQSVNAYFTCGTDAATWLFGKKTAAEAFLMTNAVDTRQFGFNSEKRNEIKKAFGLQHKTGIIHIGRFNRQKNHQFLLQIFAELHKKDPGYHLFLVGEGELKKEIEAQIKVLHLERHVTLMGVRTDIEVLLQGMDVFLFPSLFEGLPVSLVEAQASGIKCVISDGIPTEAVLSDENVTVLPLKESAKHWAEIISKIDFSERKNVSERIKEKGYDIIENTRKLEQQYLDLLQTSTKAQSQSQSQP